MSNHVLIWAGVPHNSDGIVFQVRVVHGLQRFYLSRRVLDTTGSDDFGGGRPRKTS